MYDERLNRDSVVYGWPKKRWTPPRLIFYRFSHQHKEYITTGIVKDIAWWDRPPHTRPVPAARPPRPGRPRIYSRRIRRYRLPGTVRTGCFSPWGGAASVSRSIGQASPGMRGDGTGGMRACVRFRQARAAADRRFICQQEGAAVPSPPARASPHIPAERTKIPTGAEAELHTMVTLGHGVSVSCDAAMGIRWLHNNLTLFVCAWIYKHQVQIIARRGRNTISITTNLDIDYWYWYWNYDYKAKIN